MNERALKLLSRIGLAKTEANKKGSKPVEFRVENGKAFGSINLTVAGVDGQTIKLSREKAGAETRVEYFPGIVCLYGHDGQLRRVFCRYHERVSSISDEESAKLGAAKDIAHFLRSFGGELVFQIEVANDFFKIIREGRGASSIMATYGLETVMNCLFGIRIQLALGRSMEADFVVADENGVFFVGFGSERTVLGSPVKKSLDLAKLSVGMSEEEAKELLWAGRQVVAVLK